VNLKATPPSTKTAKLSITINNKQQSFPPPDALIRFCIVCGLTSLEKSAPFAGEFPIFQYLPW
jgi:hypothetical protein